MDRTYYPLSDYALIGDCRTAALVSNRGSIDWLCLPDFDSPSVFARLLDARHGGHFSICPTGPFTSGSSYIDYSGVVRILFRTGSGTATMTDFMPLYGGEEPERYGAPRAGRQLIRLIECTAGQVELHVEFRPRPRYGAQSAHISLVPHGASVDLDGQCAVLSSSIPLAIEDDTVTGRFVLRSGERGLLALMLREPWDSPCASVNGALELLNSTLSFWRDWHAGCRYRGPYYDVVMRSLATLKLLTYAPTGAMVAAPTTSLPEEIGGVRNWDYRYTWIRDASLGFRALLQAGHPEDAQGFMKWICEIALRCEPGKLQIMYGLRGERDLTECTLDHLPGYRNSRPVRVGNLASKQFQLDVYGELLECFELLRSSGELAAVDAKEFWPVFASQVDAVADFWREPDSGIWEMRSLPQHFVHSKVLAWLALDRGIRAAEAAGLPADRPKWRKEQDAIRQEVMTHGFNERLGAFVQSYGSHLLDAANLLLPIVGFIDSNHPRMRSTIEAIQERLLSKGLVYRYRGADDGVPGDEATFAACAFWLVEDLAALGRYDQATELFQSLLERSTSLGLFAEEIDPRSGAHLGNFPQALTHIALINAASALVRTG